MFKCISIYRNRFLLILNYYFFFFLIKTVGCRIGFKNEAKKKCHSFTRMAFKPKPLKTYMSFSKKYEKIFLLIILD